MREKTGKQTHTNLTDTKASPYALGNYDVHKRHQRRRFFFVCVCEEGEKELKLTVATAN